MPPEQLHERIADQFSYRGDRADVWRAFDLVLETDAFLNLGYSDRYHPHLLGSCQRRLVTKVGETLADHLPTTERAPLLDLGCGRGGPALHLADRFGFDVTGVDLVPYNIARAIENARGQRHPPHFIVGDVTQLPFSPASFTACTAIDSLVYLPNRETVFPTIASVLTSGGVVVLSDLVMQSDVTERERELVGAFADAWDMPVPSTVADYERAVADASLDLVTVADITAHSVGRFRRWTGPFLRLLATPARHVFTRLLRRLGLEASAIIEQVECAHRAIPALQHVLLVAKVRA